MDDRRGPVTRHGHIRASIIATSLLLLLTAVLNVAPLQSSAAGLIVETYPTDKVSIMEGETVIFTIVLSEEIDASDAIVQWYVNGNPVTSDGLAFSFETDYNDADLYSITVFVVYNATTESHDWELTVQEKKERFEVIDVDPDGEISMDEGDVQFFLVYVRNPAEDNLTFRWYVDDQYQLGNNFSSFRYDPGMDDGGDHRIRVTIVSIDHKEERSWKVVVEETLEVQPIGNISIKEGGSTAFRVLSPELLDSEVLWYLDGAVGSVASGRTFVYEPDMATAGKHTLVVNTTKGHSHQWAVSIENVNRPPTVTMGKVVRATVHEPADFKGQATDPDNDIVLYEWDFDGDGTFEYSSERDGITTHAYGTTGTFMATFRVTDAYGEMAVTTSQYVVSEAYSISGWHIASMLMGVLILLVLVWVVMDRAKERRAARAKELERMADLPMDKGPDAEAEVFEDIEEEEVEEEATFDMVPYTMKMADRDMEAEGDAGDTEIHVKDRDAVTPPSDEEEEEEAETPADQAETEREELERLLSSLGTKAQEKADLKSKKASAEVGAEDTDTEIGPVMAPSKGQKRKGRKGPRRPKDTEDKAGTSKGAESDIEAEDEPDDLDRVMRSLVEKGLAEKTTEPKKVKRKR
jgi:PKD repeat protein